MAPRVAVLTLLHEALTEDVRATSETDDESDACGASERACASSPPAPRLPHPPLFEEPLFPPSPLSRPASPGGEAHDLLARLVAAAPRAVVASPDCSPPRASRGVEAAAMGVGRMEEEGAPSPRARAHLPPPPPRPSPSAGEHAAAEASDGGCSAAGRRRGGGGGGGGGGGDGTGSVSSHGLRSRAALTALATVAAAWRDGHDGDDESKGAMTHTGEGGGAGIARADDNGGGSGGGGDSAPPAHPPLLPPAPGADDGMPTDAALRRWGEAAAGGGDARIFILNNIMRLN